MKLRVVCIGKARRGDPHDALVADYAGRIGRYLPFELEIAGEAQGDDALARREEAALIRRRLRPRDSVVLLDERGEAQTSVGLAQRLAGAERAGGRDLAFVLGGPSGFDPSLRETAAWSLSLSKLTLPHLLARVVLVEQLYRALTLLRGEPYHK
ncbi:MAG: 23S rRNA (pseudouridine(1915)-N(3))-methyltransferase RlmH [Deltaproteobacteria bacterium]